MAWDSRRCTAVSMSHSMARLAFSAPLGWRPTAETNRCTPFCPIFPKKAVAWCSQILVQKCLIYLNKDFKFTTEAIEQKDPRGRTPLLLAVTLGYVEATQVLLDAGANVNCEKDGWTAVQEATATGNAELLSMVLTRRDYQRYVLRAGGIPDLLKRLSLAPDFYVEMKWEFTSWVPLVSRMCPFDTYKVYKRGSNVRVDTTLVGFENNRWQRGDRSYIFTAQDNSATLVEVDHEKRLAYCTYMERVEDRGGEGGWPPPSDHSLLQRLAQPIALTHLHTDNITFERNKSGIWGWRQDKMETVNGYECKVFAANNVEVISKARSEHLPSGSKKIPAASFLPFAPGVTASKGDDEDLIPEDDDPVPDDLPPVSWEQYFSGEQLDHDIGRPKRAHTKVQKFRATLWLCEDYPLELQEQIMPILDLMASLSSPHFAKLKDFIQMQLPAGFPVKIEIPLFHVMNARITFGNIFGSDTPVPNVTTIQEDGRQSCILDDACFAVPAGYRDSSAVDERLCLGDDEEGLLQYAIQQSLMEAGTDEEQVDVWEALTGARPSSPSPSLSSQTSPSVEHRLLQRAIEESLASASASYTQLPKKLVSDVCETELEKAIRLSLAEHLAKQALSEHERDEEQKALDMAIRLSLDEK